MDAHKDDSSPEDTQPQYVQASRTEGIPAAQSERAVSQQIDSRSFEGEDQWSDTDALMEASYVQSSRTTTREARNLPHESEDRSIISTIGQEGRASSLDSDGTSESLEAKKKMDKLFLSEKAKVLKITQRVPGLQCETLEPDSSCATRPSSMFLSDSIYSDSSLHESIEELPSDSVAMRSPPHESVLQRSPPHESVLQRSPPHESVLQRSPTHESVLQRSPTHESVAKRSPTHESVAKRSPTHKSVAKRSPTHESVAKRSPTHWSVRKRSPFHGSVPKRSQSHDCVSSRSPPMPSSSGTSSSAPSIAFSPSPVKSPQRPRVQFVSTPEIVPYEEMEHQAEQPARNQVSRRRAYIPYLIGFSVFFPISGYTFSQYIADRARGSLFVSIMTGAFALVCGIMACVRINDALRANAMQERPEAEELVPTAPPPEQEHEEEDQL